MNASPPQTIANGNKCSSSSSSGSKGQGGGGGGARAGGCSLNRDLLPVHLAAFNIREIVKQMLLLEDHLYHADKRCAECIAKHFLTIEALSEEGVTLDGTDEGRRVLKALAPYARHLHARYVRVAGLDAHVTSVALNLRSVRKFLMAEALQDYGAGDWEAARRKTPALPAVPAAPTRAA
jgi:hypothetical protein